MAEISDLISNSLGPSTWTSCTHTHAHLHTAHTSEGGHLCIILNESGVGPDRISADWATFGGVRGALVCASHTSANLLPQGVIWL